MNFEEENKKLRKLLCSQHSHSGNISGIYWDDGEMSCGDCGCDFLRDSVEELLAKIIQYNLRRFTESV